MKHLTPIKTGVIILFVAFFSACSKSGSNPTPQNNTPTMTITALDVTSGPYRTLVDISGTGFSSANGGNQVFFNRKTAEIYSFTDSKIYAYVPLGAGTGNVTVTANGVTAKGPVFTYQPSLVVTTFAGNASQIGLKNGAAASATFNQLAGMAIDGSGNLYVADSHNFVIRKITPQGNVTTFAGSGGMGNADGTASTASFTSPSGVAVDKNGNVFVTDQVACLIRKITPDRTVSTFAGDGLPHSNDGVGKGASFNNPMGITVDANDNLYVADRGSHAIRKITANGTVTTIAGNSGNEGTSDGVGAAASFTSPEGITLGSDGSLYVTDSYGGPVRKITLPNTVTSVGTVSLYDPQGIIMDTAGNLYVTSPSGGVVHKITSDGTTSTFAGSSEAIGIVDGAVNKAGFGFPAGIAIDASGNIFVSDISAVREISVQ
jgi:sugar lactone lactonase YvrE